MQITVLESKIGKTGKNDKGEWELIVVKAEGSGIDYTTFDKKAKVSPGTTLEIGEPDVKDGKHSFKKCDIISAAPELAPSFSNGKEYKKDLDGMKAEYTYKAGIEKIRNASIEAQTAFNGAISLINKGHSFTDEQYNQIKGLVEKAIAWGEAHLSPTDLEEQLEKMSNLGSLERPQQEPGKAGERSFKNVGELLTACLDEYGMSREVVMAECGVKIPSDIKDLNAAWQTISSVHKIDFK